MGLTDTCRVCCAVSVGGLCVRVGLPRQILFRVCRVSYMYALPYTNVF